MNDVDYCATKLTSSLEVKAFKTKCQRKNIMHILWGSLIMAAGLFMLVCGSLKSKFIIYRLMVARSKILWSENVHRFYQITGAIVIIFGALVAFGYI